MSRQAAGKRSFSSSNLVHEKATITLFSSFWLHLMLFSVLGHVHRTYSTSFWNLFAISLHLSFYAARHSHRWFTSACLLMFV